MDPDRFDRLVRSLEQPASRKRAVRLLGGLVGGVVAVAGLRDASAHPGARLLIARRRGDGGDSGDSGDDTGGDSGDGGVPPETTPVERRPQSQFVHDCRNAGGTPSRVSTYKVQCCFPPVPDHPTTSETLCTTCDFRQDPPGCTDTWHRSGGDHTVENPGGGMVNTP